MKDVYITAIGKYLPGEAISNDEMEDYLGRIGGKPSRIKDRILKQNGIQKRYYAIDKNQNTTMQNSEMAVKAIHDAIEKSPLHLEDVQFLATATTQGDLPVPGFASMVHGESGIPTCEIASYQGVCASSLIALKGAFLQIKSGEKSNAVVCGSELPSRLFKAQRFEDQNPTLKEKKIEFETEFLRWMLSDGAGACVLESSPKIQGLSLKINWIEIHSFANEFETCMYVGPKKENGKITKSWLDFPNQRIAADEGAFNLKQDISMLDDLVKVGVTKLLEVMDRQKISFSELNWLVCHYSSAMLKEKVRKGLNECGIDFPAERWFSNLSTCGNTGAASIFINLEELFNSNKLTTGQRILCVVPESGRFTHAYMELEVVGQNQPNESIEIKPKQLELSTTPNQESQTFAIQMAQVWLDFERELATTPFLRKLNSGKIKREDYAALLKNLRQQVIEGSRWIARASSQITEEYSEYRSLFLKHSVEEHQDYKMLEKDYVSLGLSPDEIINYEKNDGSEAFSAWMFHNANLPNPFNLLGAMFIIEGLGKKLAGTWAQKLKAILRLEDHQISFLLYHSKNDDNHMEKLDLLLRSDLLNENLKREIVKTARITSKLYCMQLREIKFCEEMLWKS